MRLKVLQDFSWAHRNVEVAPYEAGQLIDTEDADLIRVALEEGWAEPEEQADEQLGVDELKSDRVGDQRAADEQSSGEQKTMRVKRAAK